MNTQNSHRNRYAEESASPARTANPEFHQNSRDLLRKQIEIQEQIIRGCSDQIMENQQTLASIYDTIFSFRNSKMYRLLIIFRRFQAQVLRNEWGGIPDFLKWVISRVCRKEGGEPLNQFDKLYGSEKFLLNQIAKNDQVLNFQLKKNPTNVLQKRTRHILIFAGVPYYDIGGGQRFSQLAKTFNAMGYRVSYIYRRDSFESERKIMYIPAIQHLHLSQYPLEKMAADLQQGDMLFFELPHPDFLPYLDYAKTHGYSTVYEHVDNWDSSLGTGFYDSGFFSHFLQLSDHVTVTARLLGDKISESGRGDFIYCPNAVDITLFNPWTAYEKPRDLVTGSRTLLYFGSLWGEWFDWDLLLYVSKKCDCQINLIGDYHPILKRVKKFPSNIHCLGIKKQAELPAYLYHCDIALLPFKTCNIGNYVSPLKIFEYIAMNKPVLSTPLDDIQNYPNVFLSENRDEWVRAIQEGIPTGDAYLFTVQNCWYARCNQLLDIIGRPSRSQPSLSIIVLNESEGDNILSCLRSIHQFSDSYHPEIIVVQPESADDSWIDQEPEENIQLLKAKEYASARNLGALCASGEYLLFLHSRQRILGDRYLDAALDALAQNVNLAAVSISAGWFERGQLSNLTSETVPNGGLRGPWVMCQMDVGYLGGYGMLIKKSVFDWIKDTDPRFEPMFLGDQDFSMQLRQAGFQLGYCPYMAISKYQPAFDPVNHPDYKALYERSHRLFLEKWDHMISRFPELNL